MAAQTERPEPVVLAPGIESRADVQGGEPVIAGTRVETEAVYSWWRAPRDVTWERLPFGSVLGAIAEQLSLDGWERAQAAVCFEAGRRYERERMRRDKRRRWVGSINDADAHRALGHADAVGYLRSAGQPDLAAGLAAAMEQREKERP